MATRTTVTAIDDTIELYQTRDLSSRVIATVPKGAKIQLGALEEAEGREWIEATFEDGPLGYILAPSARSHTTLGASAPAPAKRPAEGDHAAEWSGAFPAVAGPDAGPGGTAGDKRLEKPWICPKCNVLVISPRVSNKNKRTCPEGHSVERPMGFLGGMVGIVVFVVVAAAASHIVGMIWSVPARLLNAFTVGAGVGLGPWLGLVRGIMNLGRGGMARRLVGGYFGLMVGSLGLMFFILTAEFSAKPGPFPIQDLPPTVSVVSGVNALYSTNPDRPSLTNSGWEGACRFFMPYGMDFGYLDSERLTNK